jgi:hypothetical protein
MEVVQSGRLEAMPLAGSGRGLLTSHRTSPIIADGAVGYPVPTAIAATVIPSYLWGPPSPAGEPSMFVRPQSEQQGRGSIIEHVP